ncbi:GNAT family N-acetyltransferase [Stenotrophomonas humi]|uniref:GNAT family N-acetyltransferase n=1 Tax=Stenotrophomonas humi TaxID=405444 RepID=UPI0009FB5AEC|nr:GNAT family N-acetyltransferase [Stenotrophomonas humi]
MTLRAYQPADAAGCLSVFDSNVPGYFASGERIDFQRFLDDQAMQCAYQVIEEHGRILACGGLSVNATGIAGFCWGMVLRSHHRQGLGRQLANARLQQALQHPDIKHIALSTSQHTQAFYERLGFAVTRIVPDGHGPGLDAVEMRLSVDDNRAALSCSTTSSTPTR